jgi:hypothetical protein
VGGAAGLRHFLIEHDLIEHDLSGLPPGHMTSAHDALDQDARLQARRGGQIRHLQRIFAPEESRCLCLFESSGTGVIPAGTDAAQFPLANVVAVMSSRPSSDSAATTGEK